MNYHFGELPSSSLQEQMPSESTMSGALAGLAFLQVGDVIYGFSSACGHGRLIVLQLMLFWRRTMLPQRKRAIRRSAKRKTHCRRKAVSFSQSRGERKRERERERVTTCDFDLVPEMSWTSSVTAGKTSS